MTDTKLQNIVIDAQGQPLGRVAAKAAHLLRGKDLPSFAPNRIPDRTIVITNTDGLILTGNKAADKKYYHHSGYPGGIKEQSFKKLFKQDSRNVVRKAVYGMLPVNRLRKKSLARLQLHVGAAEVIQQPIQETQ